MYRVKGAIDLQTGGRIDDVEFMVVPVFDAIVVRTMSLEGEDPFSQNRG